MSCMQYQCMMLSCSYWKAFVVTRKIFRALCAADALDMKFIVCCQTSVRTCKVRHGVDCQSPAKYLRKLGFLRFLVSRNRFKSSVCSVCTVWVRLAVVFLRSVKHAYKGQLPKLVRAYRYHALPLNPSRALVGHVWGAFPTLRNGFRSNEEPAALVSLRAYGAVLTVLFISASVVNSSSWLSNRSWNIVRRTFTRAVYCFSCFSNVIG